MFQITKTLESTWRILENGTMIPRVVDLYYRLSVAVGEVASSVMEQELRFMCDGKTRTVTEDVIGVDIQTRQFRVLGANKNLIRVFMRAKFDDPSNFLGMVQEVEVAADSNSLFNVKFRVAEVSGPFWVNGKDGGNVLCPAWADWVDPRNPDKKGISRYELIKRRDHGQGTADADSEIA